MSGLALALWAQLVVSQVAVPDDAPEHASRALEKVNEALEDGDPQMPAITAYEVAEDGSDPRMFRYYAYLRAHAGCARPNQRCERAAQLFKNGGEELAEFLLRHYETCLGQGHVNCSTFVRQSGHTGSTTAWTYIHAELQKPRSELGDRVNDLIMALAYTEAPEALEVVLDMLADGTDERTRGLIAASMEYSLLYAPFLVQSHQQLREQAIEALVDMEKSSSGEPQSVRRAAFSALEKLERSVGESLRVAPTDMP